MELGRHPVFIHKDEWNRMKSVGTSTVEPLKTNEYLQALIEKSQQWINSWPDSIQGRVLKLEKEKKKQQAEDMAMIKLFRKEQKKIYKRNKCIEKAKQIIFDDSCYGTSLISALRESKALEERDAQVEFQKKIKTNAAEGLNHNEIDGSLHKAIDMENQEKERARRKRQRDKEIAQLNKTIYQTQCEDKKLDKERQKRIEIEDLRLIEELNKNEADLEAQEKNQFKEDLEKLKAEQKLIQDRKALAEKEEEKRIEIWRKYEERKSTIMKRINEKRFEKSQTTHDLVKRLNDEKQNRYNEFVNKGIKTLMRRLEISEHEENEKKVEERKKHYLLLQSNKKLEHAKRLSENDKNVLTCHRQCIIGNCEHIPEIKQSPGNRDKLALAPPENKLVKNLKIREREPSPWSGLPAAHAEFARNADRTLQECRYKHATRKVVDDYRRSHGLTAQDLPIANYF